jgi:hypothetical protein
LDLQQEHLKEELSEIEAMIKDQRYLRFFDSKFDQIREQDEIISKFKRQLMILMKDKAYNKYLLEMEQHLSDKYRYLWECSKIELDEAKNNLVYLQNTITFSRLDLDSMKNEDTKRNSTEQYIYIVEGEIHNLNNYLEKLKMNNPNYAFLALNPVVELRK